MRPLTKFEPVSLIGLVSNAISHLKPIIIAKKDEDAIKTASFPAYSKPCIWVISKFAKKMIPNGNR